MADWLDIFLRLWENFGMWGIIILLVFLVLYFTVRAWLKRYQHAHTAGSSK